MSSFISVIIAIVAIVACSCRSVYTRWQTSLSVSETPFVRESFVDVDTQHVLGLVIII